MLDGWADAVSVFELASADRPRPGSPGRGAGWADELWLAEVCVVEGIAATAPDVGELARRAAGEGLPAPDAPLAGRDWLAENRRGLRAAQSERMRSDPARRLPRRPCGSPRPPRPAFAPATPHHGACLRRLDRLRVGQAEDAGRAPCWTSRRHASSPCGRRAFWPGVRCGGGDIDPAPLRCSTAMPRSNGLRLPRRARGRGGTTARCAPPAPSDANPRHLLYSAPLRLAPGIAAPLRPAAGLCCRAFSSGRNCRCASRCAARACVSAVRAASTAGPR